MSERDATGRRTRRRFLGSAAVAGVVGLAGCGSTSGGGNTTTIGQAIGDAL